MFKAKKSAALWAVCKTGDLQEIFQCQVSYIFVNFTTYVYIQETALDFWLHANLICGPWNWFSAFNLL